ncbi:MAG: NUDIX hydrolase [bacterium]
MNKAKVHKIRQIHTGKVFRLVQEELTLPNGFTTCLELIRHPGAAALVPLLDDHRVLLIRQYRHAVGQFIWEIPAGTRSAGEDPLECAKRELIEETGYEASELILLGEMVPVPGYSDERIHIYLARGLSPVPQRLEQDEVLEVHPLQMHKAFHMVKKGQIQDAKTIVGLTLALSHLGTGVVG